MPILLGLLLALGLLITWYAVTGDDMAPDAAPDPVAAEPLAACLATWLRAAGLALTPGQFLLRAAGAGLGTATLAWLLTGWPVLAAAGALAGPALLVGLTDRLAAASARQIALDLEVAVGQLRGLVAAGLSLSAAIEELARRGPERLRPALAGVCRAASLPGDGLAAGLATLPQTLGPAADDLAEALIVAHRTGADALLPVLDQLAAALRGRREVAEALAVAQHRTVLQARFLVATPLVLLLVMRVLSPSFTAVYDTPLGAVWLAVIVALVGAGYWLMRRVGRVAAPPRAWREPS